MTAPFCYYAPLDPDCPAVVSFHDAHDNDPISHLSGCMDELLAAFERTHRRVCGRCREYGAANIEVAEVQ